MPKDLDLRKLRYFVAIAEELNFGRAAERLHIAQPVLTRQLRALESEVGVQLVERSTRGTKLSPPGERILDDARALLLAAEALQRRARRAARGGTGFTVGFMPGILPTAAVRALRQRFPGLQVEVVRTSWDDQVEGVHNGSLDASFVRFPIDTRGLKVVPLFSEPRVAVLPAGHPLAARDTVSIVDLAELDLRIRTPYLSGGTPQRNSAGRRHTSARAPGPARSKRSWSSSLESAGSWSCPSPPRSSTHDPTCSTAA
jgi:DNA-binding transcriptional LysR family regulator